MSDPDEPQSFQEACWDPDLISREKWREAIHLEFKKMSDMGVWRHVKRNDHPNDCRLVACRWLFKVKRNGVYHARLVAKGFSQIPGVDFTDNYSPVVNKILKYMRIFTPGTHGVHYSMFRVCTHK